MNFIKIKKIKKFKLEKYFSKENLNMEQKNIFNNSLFQEDIQKSPTSNSLNNLVFSSIPSEYNFHFLSTDMQCKTCSYDAFTIMRENKFLFNEFLNLKSEYVIGIFKILYNILNFKS